MGVGRVAVPKTRAMVAREISREAGLKEWERRKLGELSLDGLTALARRVVPGYQSVELRGPEDPV